jgi:hypothetical protein
MFEVYILADQHGEVVYVGQGRAFYVDMYQRRRLQKWLAPSGYKTLGLAERPKVPLLCLVATREKALEVEAQLIARFKPRCNKATSGNATGCSHSATARMKMSLAHRGKPKPKPAGWRPWNYGQPVSPELKAKISAGIKKVFSEKPIQDRWKLKTSWNAGLTYIRSEGKKSSRRI